MDLFIINRYKDTDDESNRIDLEARHFQRLKQKIEERKKANLSKREIDQDEIVLKTNDQIDYGSQDTADTGTELKNNDSYPEPETTVIQHSSISHINQDKKPNVEFKVIGANEFEKKVKVKRVLPHWLSNPVGISTDLQNLSCHIDKQDWLHPILKSTLEKEGVTHLFPVQEKVVPFVLKQHLLPAPFWPSDICVSAPTGSGKTLSFVLPVIQVVMNDVGRYVKALIVLPVQELAGQVAKVFKKYCTSTGLKVALLSGSTPLRQEQQQLVRYTESSGWVSEVDIIICTAGRLVEHLSNTEGFSLRNLKFLVIDEADRIMDHIQNDWLHHLDRHIKSDNQLMSGKVPIFNWINLKSQKMPPHKLLFSATLSQDPEKLEQWGLFQPKLFSIAPKSLYEDDEQIRKYMTPVELTEKCIVSEPEEKPLILYHLLVEEKWSRVLCFTNSSQSAHRLTVLLKYLSNDTLRVAELSAALDRTNRDSVLKKFQESEVNVLIGTDALARGIDIPDCDYVISYDLPRNIKTYIHRVGRTGRAGRKGCAVTMLHQNQVHLFKDILSIGGKTEVPQLKIPQEIFEMYSEKYHNCMQETKKHIEEELSSKVKKSIALKRGFNSKTNVGNHQNSKKYKLK